VLELDELQKVFPEETHQAVGKESGQTSHVERWNNILRQRLARFRSPFQNQTASITWC
jgi:IS1 family transposase